jgi:hypothetical protein
MAKSLGALTVRAAGIPSTYDAYARTLEKRFADSVDITDFGAVGDWNGTTGTDNTAAIQAAIFEAMPLDGVQQARPLFFPPGNYAITASLRLQGITGGLIHGCGMGASVITFVGPGNTGNIWGNPAFGGGDYALYTPVFLCEGLYVCTFENFSVRGTTANRTSLNSKTQGFFFISPNVDDGPGGGFDLCMLPAIPRSATISTACLFQNIEFSNFALDGVFMGTGANAENYLYINCLVNQCDRMGLYAPNQNSLNHIVIGGKVSNCGSKGAFAVTDEVLDNIAGGLIAPGGSFLKISGVLFDNNHIDIVQDQAGVNIVGCMTRGGPMNVVSILISQATGFVSGFTYHGQSTGCFIHGRGNAAVHCTSSKYDPHIYATGLAGNSGAGFIFHNYQSTFTVDNLVVTSAAKSGGSFNVSLETAAAYAPYTIRNCDFDGSPFPPAYGTHIPPYANITIAPVTIAQLPPPDAAYNGIRAVVKDYTNTGTPAFWSATLTAGGTRYVPVIYDGFTFSWRIGG